MINKCTNVFATQLPYSAVISMCISAGYSALFCPLCMHIIQGDQKVSVHLMITVQKNTQKYSILNRIHPEYGPCYTEHGLREHSSTCQ